MFYYFVLLFSYDWPELILGAIGAVALVCRPTMLGVFLVWGFVLSLAVYTWAGEKMPWLVLHPLLPLLLLAGIAGIGLQALWRDRRALAGRLGLLVAAIGAVYLVHATTALICGGPRYQGLQSSHGVDSRASGLPAKGARVPNLISVRGLSPAT